MLNLDQLIKKTQTITFKSEITLKRNKREINKYQFLMDYSFAKIGTFCNAENPVQKMIFNDAQIFVSNCDNSF
jgi:hypothetical protein